MKRLLLVAIAAASLVALALGAKVHVSPTQKLKHGYAFQDEHGRTLLFHGVNAVYKVSPWIPSIDAFDPELSLCEEDAKHLSAWGFNFVRLGAATLFFKKVFFKKKRKPTTLKREPKG